MFPVSSIKLDISEALKLKLVDFFFFLNDWTLFLSFSGNIALCHWMVLLNHSHMHILKPILMFSSLQAESIFHFSAFKPSQFGHHVAFSPLENSWKHF